MGARVAMYAGKQMRSCGDHDISIHARAKNASHVPLVSAVWVRKPLRRSECR